MRPLDLMIVGAPKAGTTSLKNYLGQHPGICTHQQREFLFFGSDRTYEKGFQEACRQYFCEVSPSQRVTLGKSVAMMYSDRAMDRLLIHNPDVHVVVLLRNPVDRAYSEYWYARRRGWENRRSFAEAVEEERKITSGRRGRNFRSAFLQRSTYVRYLSPILRRFGAEHVHIFLTSELAANADEVCRSLICLFPELAQEFTLMATRRENAAAAPRSHFLLKLTASKSTAPLLRRTLRRVLSARSRQLLKQRLQRLNERSIGLPPLESDVRISLTEYFRPYNQRLAKCIKKDLSEWESKESRNLAPLPAQ